MEGGDSVICPFGYEVGEPPELGACVRPSTLARCQCVEVVAEYVVGAFPDDVPPELPKVLRWWTDRGVL